MALARVCDYQEGDPRDPLADSIDGEAAAALKKKAQTTFQRLEDGADEEGIVLESAE